MEETTRTVGEGVSFVDIVFSSEKDVQAVPSESCWESLKAFITSLGLFHFLEEELRNQSNKGSYLELNIDITLLFLDENVFDGAKGLA